MMGTIAPTAAPPHAVRCWLDGRSLYFELSGVNGPVVLAFTPDSAGFSRAISVLFARHAAEGHGEVYIRPELPSTIPDKDGISEAQRREARDLLKKMGII